MVFSIKCGNCNMLLVCVLLLLLLFLNWIFGRFMCISFRVRMFSVIVMLIYGWISWLDILFNCVVCLVFGSWVRFIWFILLKLFSIKVVNNSGVNMFVNLFSKFIKVMCVVVLFCDFKCMINGLDVVCRMVRLEFIINWVIKNIVKVLLSVVGINNR